MKIDEKDEKPKPKRLSIQWGGKGFASKACHRAIQEAAKQAGLPVAAYMRRASFLATGGTLEPDAEA